MLLNPVPYLLLVRMVGRSKLYPPSRLWCYSLPSLKTSPSYHPVNWVQGYNLTPPCPHITHNPDREHTQMTAALSPEQNVFSFCFRYKSKSRSVESNSLRPHGLYIPWNSPGQNTGVGTLSLLQGIFPTQGSNPGLLHCRQILYQLNNKGSPRILEWVAYPFNSRANKL